MNNEELIKKGVFYVMKLRRETSEYNICNPAFVSFIAALVFADKNNINFNHVVDALCVLPRFKAVNKFRNDFNAFRNYRNLIEDVYLEATEDIFH